MIRSRDLILSCFLVGLALNASAQQSQTSGLTGKLTRADFVNHA
jgi:hypothetical protein